MILLGNSLVAKWVREKVIVSVEHCVALLGVVFIGTIGPCGPHLNEVFEAPQRTKSSGNDRDVEGHEEGAQSIVTFP